MLSSATIRSSHMTQRGRGNESTIQNMMAWDSPGGPPPPSQRNQRVNNFPAQEQYNAPPQQPQRRRNQAFESSVQNALAWGDETQGACAMPPPRPVTQPMPQQRGPPPDIRPLRRGKQFDSPPAEEFLWPSQRPQLTQQQRRRNQQFEPSAENDWAQAQAPQTQCQMPPPQLTCPVPIPPPPAPLASSCSSRPPRGCTSGELRQQVELIQKEIQMTKEAVEVQDAQHREEIKAKEAETAAALKEIEVTAAEVTALTAKVEQLMTEVQAKEAELVTLHTANEIETEHMREEIAELKEAAERERVGRLQLAPQLNDVTNILTQTPDRVANLTMEQEQIQQEIERYRNAPPLAPEPFGFTANRQDMRCEVPNDMMAFSPEPERLVQYSPAQKQEFQGQCASPGGALRLWEGDHSEPEYNDECVRKPNCGGCPCPSSIDLRPSGKGGWGKGRRSEKVYDPAAEPFCNRPNSANQFDNNLNLSPNTMNYFNAPPSPTYDVNEPNASPNDSLRLQQRAQAQLCEFSQQNSPQNRQRAASPGGDYAYQQDGSPLQNSPPSQARPRTPAQSPPIQVRGAYVEQRDPNSPPIRAGGSNNGGWYQQEQPSQLQRPASPGGFPACPIPQNSPPNQAPSRSPPPQSPPIQARGAYADQRDPNSPPIRVGGNTNGRQWYDEEQPASQHPASTGGFPACPIPQNSPPFQAQGRNLSPQSPPIQARGAYADQRDPNSPPIRVGGNDRQQLAFPSGFPSCPIPQNSPPFQARASPQSPPIQARGAYTDQRDPSSPPIRVGGNNNGRQWYDQEQPGPQQRPASPGGFPACPIPQQNIALIQAQRASTPPRSPPIQGGYYQQAQSPIQTAGNSNAGRYYNQTQPLQRPFSPVGQEQSLMQHGTPVAAYPTTPTSGNRGGGYDERRDPFSPPPLMHHSTPISGRPTTPVSPENRAGYFGQHDPFSPIPRQNFQPYESPALQDLSMGSYAPDISFEGFQNSITSGAAGIMDQSMPSFGPDLSFEQFPCDLPSPRASPQNSFGSGALGIMDQSMPSFASSNISYQGFNRSLGGGMMNVSDPNQRSPQGQNRRYFAGSPQDSFGSSGIMDVSMPAYDPNLSFNMSPVNNRRSPSPSPQGRGQNQYGYPARGSPQQNNSFGSDGPGIMDMSMPSFGQYNLSPQGSPVFDMSHGEGIMDVSNPMNFGQCTP